MLFNDINNFIPEKRPLFEDINSLGLEDVQQYYRGVYAKIAGKGWEQIEDFVRERGKYSHIHTTIGNIYRLELVESLNPPSRYYNSYASIRRVTYNVGLFIRRGGKRLAAKGATGGSLIVSNPFMENVDLYSLHTSNLPSTLAIINNDLKVWSLAKATSIIRDEKYTLSVGVKDNWLVASSPTNKGDPYLLFYKMIPVGTLSHDLKATCSPLWKQELKDDFTDEIRI